MVVGKPGAGGGPPAASAHVPPAKDDDPWGAIAVIGIGHYERHWTSRLAHWLVDLHGREWRNLWPIWLALLAILLEIVFNVF